MIFKGIFRFLVPLLLVVCLGQTYAIRRQTVELRRADRQLEEDTAYFQRFELLMRDTHERLAAAEASMRGCGVGTRAAMTPGKVEAMTTEEMLALLLLKSRDQ